MAEIVVRIDASEVEAAMSRLASGVFKNRMLRAVGALAERQTKQRFGTKVSPDGAPWAPWVSRRGKKRGRGILVDTGRLMGGVSNFVSGDTVTVGSNVFYGAFHQFGTSKMVARPWLGASQANLAEIERVLVQHLRAVFG